MSIEQESQPSTAEPVFDIELYDSLIKRLGGYERKYKVTSGMLARRISDGTLAETPEVRDWVGGLAVLRDMASEW